MNKSTNTPVRKTMDKKIQLVPGDEHSNCSLTAIMKMYGSE
jgi:hypothetical protein